MPFRWIVAIGCRLERIERLPGAKKMIAKIAHEGWTSSALGELAVAAALHAQGLSVELEPQVPAGQSPPDVRVVAAGQSIHIEVVRPELSAEQADSFQLLARLAQGISAARAELVRIEALVTWPPKEDTESRFLTAAASVSTAIPGAHIELPGAGALWVSGPTEPLTSRIDPPVSDNETACLSGHFPLGSASSSRRVDTETRIAYDKRLGEILARKRHRQLPRDGHNLFVLDVTRVPEGLRIAPPIVRRFLTQTGRVGAVVVFDDGDDGRVIPLVNERARATLSAAFVDTLARGLTQLVR